MPLTLPQLPDSMFSSYDPRYMPGYTGYTLKLRSDKGKLYGNATLKSCDYEPGYPRFPLSALGRYYNATSDLLLGGTVTNIARENAENWHNNNGHFYPASGKYHISRRIHTINGDPKTSNAVNAIEEIKYELSRPAKPLPMNRSDSLRKDLGTARAASSCFARKNEQVDEPENTPMCENRMMKKTLRKDSAEKTLSTNIYSTNDYLQRRQGKIIYRANSGLLPNYSGYTPGQMFLIGSTWGKSSINAIGKLQDQRFQWTSLF
ncbi:uncharacterized protein PAF06_016269 [Gastrophryne carolinensis]